MFNRINAMLHKKFGEPEATKPGKFKIKYNTKATLPGEDEDEREVAFSIKIMAANEADFGKRIVLEAEEDEADEVELPSMDLFVSFQKNATSDHDMFMNCYQDFKKDMLATAG